MGPLHGHPEELAGEHVRRRPAAPDDRRPGRRQAPVDALGPPQPELQHRLVAGGVADAGGLRRDEGLEVDDVEEGRLQQLALDQRPLDPHERLVAEHHGPLGHGVDVAGEAKLRQVGQEFGLEQRPAVAPGQGRQVGQVVVGEAKPLQELDRRLQS